MLLQYIQKQSFLRKLTLTDPQAAMIVLMIIEKQV